ncbi:MAG: C39 family peptidase [Cyanobium sp.]
MAVQSRSRSNDRLNPHYLYSHDHDFAARRGYSKGLPHQIEAWQWLQQQLSPQQLEGFAERFRRTPEAPAAPELITAEACEQVFGRPISPDQLADLNACLRRFEIDTPARICHLLAQISHESGGLRWLEELADGSAYEGRRDLGNTEPGDGRRFKGAGAIQLTGRANYEAFSRFIADPAVMGGCGYVASHYPFSSAGFWWHNNRINEEVDAGASCRRISRLVNGRDPANGLADREACFARACAVIGPAPTGGEAAGGAGSVGASSASGTGSTSRRLPVPYFCQLDSSTDQAQRMCFSSSCAMVVAALKPGLIQGDDHYLAIVNRFGDSTDASAQIQALDSLGIQAHLDLHADFSTLESQINRGFPVPCGFIHRGPVEAPRDGGHWLCVVGYTPKSLIVNDPNGDLDLLEGVYGSRQGEGLHYSRRNFGRRWMVEEDAEHVFAPGHGWAVVVDRLNP